MGRERNNQGRFADGIPPGAVLEAFADRDDRARPLTAGDIVDELGIARRTAHNKLNRLVERDVLETRKVGARGRVWWVPDPVAGDGPEEPASSTDASADGQDATDTSADPSTPADRRTDAPRDDTPEDPVERTLRDLNLPGSGGKLDARKTAVRTMYDHLREHPGDTLEKDELLELVDADAVAYQDTESFWGNCIKANKSQGRENALVALPGVEDWGSGEYRFIPDDTDGLE